MDAPLPRDVATAAAQGDLIVSFTYSAHVYMIYLFLNEFNILCCGMLLYSAESDEY